MRLWPLWTATFEWTTVIPEDHPMALFVNGQVARADTCDLQWKTGVLYRRRTLTWRGRWRTVEAGSRAG